MTLSQRRWCVRLWSVMAIALLALFGAVLIVRERIAEAAHALANG
ncbi:MAG: hypothetical protein NW203_11195 [Hyphomonadaceae bacterium]|nr:hypothetical protein [Hyphomonadaceae bacterium]